MRSVIRVIFISLTITTLISCDLLDNLMNKNHFADVADSSSISLSESDFTSLNDEDRGRVVNKYTEMVYDPLDSKKLYDGLRGEENAAALKALSDLIIEEIADLKTELTTIVTGITTLEETKETNENYITELNSLLNQYISKNKKYQKLNVALAKINIYPRDLVEKSIIEGTQLALVGYESGIITQKLDTSIIREYLLDIKDGVTTGEELEAKKAEIKILLDGINKGAEGLKNLGESIVDRDFPSTPYIDEDDAAFVLLTLVLDKIIEDSYSSPSNTRTYEQLIDAIGDDLINNANYDQYIIYPDKMSGSVYSERYLGKYGALVFAATNYKLPEAVLLEGGEQ